MQRRSVVLFWAAHLFYTADLAAKVAATAAAVAGLIAARRYLGSRKKGEKLEDEPPSDAAKPAQRI